MRPQITIAVNIIAATAVLVACTSTKNGAPTAEPGTLPPSGTTPSTSPSKDDTFGAPRVANPLDATRFIAQPCAVLTQTQMRQFNIGKPGEPDTDSEIAKAGAPACLWKADGEPFRGLSIALLTSKKKGLSDTYRERDKFDYFEPTTVEGYPAVFADGPDGRAQGICSMTVGVSDTLTFLAGEHAGAARAHAACDGAKELAAAVIATLKGGG